MRRANGFFTVVAALSLAGCTGVDLTSVPDCTFDVVFGCDGGDGRLGGGFTIDPAVSRIEIQPDSARLAVGETRDFRATTFGLSDDTVVVGLIWRSRDTTVITVSPNFNHSDETVTVRARGVGEAFLWIQGGCCFVTGWIATDSVRIVVE